MDITWILARNMLRFCIEICVKFLMMCPHKGKKSFWGLDYFVAYFFLLFVSPITDATTSAPVRGVNNTEKLQLSLSGLSSVQKKSDV